MSGTMITGIKTTLKNTNTCWATGFTKVYSLLPIWKKGKDSKKPSMRPIRTPPQTCGVISVSLEGSHRDPRLRPTSPPRSRVVNLPSSRQIISASLEGTQPALKQGEPSPPRSRPPLDEEDKRPCRSPAHRTKALNANHSSQRLGRTASGRHSPQWL